MAKDMSIKGAAPITAAQKPIIKNNLEIQGWVQLQCECGEKFRDDNGRYDPYVWALDGFLTEALEGAHKDRWRDVDGKTTCPICVKGGK